MAEASDGSGDGGKPRAVDTAAAEAPNRDRRPRDMVIDGMASEIQPQGAAENAAEGAAKGEAEGARAAGERPAESPETAAAAEAASGEDRTEAQPPKRDPSRPDPAPESNAAVSPPRPSRVAPVVTGGLAGAVVAGLVAFGAPMFMPKPAPDAGLVGRVARLEGAPSPDAALGALAKRLDALDAAGNAAQAAQAAAADHAAAIDRAAKADRAAASGRAAALAKRIDALKKDIEAVAAAAPASAGAQPPAAPATDVPPAASAGDLAALATRVAALEATAKTLQATAKTLQAASGKSAPDGAARLSLAADAAVADLAAGLPLKPALAALAAQGVSADALAPLAPYSDKPAPSAGDLAAALAAEVAAAARARAAAAPAPKASQGGVWARLTAGLGTLVKVEPASAPAASSGPAASVAAKLKAGDFVGAAQSWGEADAGFRKDTSDFGAALSARAAAGVAAADLKARALAALGAAPR